MSDENGIYLVGVTLSLLYLLSVLGGAAKDFLLSEEQCICLGMTLIFCGNLLLFHGHLIYLGLGVLVMGGGLITPNTPLLIGKLTRKFKNNEKYFTRLYGCSNAGTISGPLVVGFLNFHYGWSAGLSMNIILSTLWFTTILGTKAWRISFKNYFSSNHVLMIVGAIILSFLYLYSKTFSELTAAAIAVVYIGQLVFIIKSVDKKIACNILIGVWFLLFAIIFFSGEFQVASTTTEYAKTFLNLRVAGIHIPAGALMSLESVFVVLGALFLPKLLSLFKVESIQTRILIGLLFGASAFALLLISTLMAGNGKMTIGWIVLCFAMLGIGEIILMPSIMAYVDKISPEQYRGRLMAGIYLSLSLAGILSGFISDMVSELNKQKVTSILYYHQEFTVMIGVLVLSSLIMFLSKLIFKR